MYANAVVDCHQDFDIVDFAEKFFDTESQLLIVKEKGRKAHFHCHGTWIGDREAYKEYPHPARKGEGRSKTRPVRVAFDKDEMGFQYCCKEDPPNVIRQWHITDEQIADWHKASVAYLADKGRKLRDALSDADYWYCKDFQEYAISAKNVYRHLKRAAYDFQIEEDQKINPQHLRSHILTYMWGATTERDYERSKDPERDPDQVARRKKYKEFVLDQ